jgi:hypothetical protein
MDILSGRVYMYMVSVCSPFRQQHAIMNHFKSLLHKAWRLNDLVESNQYVSPRFFQGEAVSRLNFPCPPLRSLKIWAFLLSFCGAPARLAVSLVVLRAMLSQ